MNIILLSGGSGKRLWPLSNDIRSKQFIKLFKDEQGNRESMVQRVYRQITTVDSEARVTIATSKTQVSAIRNQLGEQVSVCVEPCRRDTFPAIALAAAYLHDVQEVGEEECVAVCPVGALTEKVQTSDVQAALDDPNKYVVVQVAPAVRAALGESFEFNIGNDVEGRIADALKQLGFDKVFDTKFGADLTIVEEANELIDRMQNDGQLARDRDLEFQV